MLTLKKVKKNPIILEFIRQTDIVLTAAGYTDHGLRHAKLVSDRARTIAREISLTKREQELAAIAGFCHDMGNFLGRTQHHYWGALLFSQLYLTKEKEDEVAIVIQAIANHDKYTMKLANPISAIVVLADKSDVHRSRVVETSVAKIREDIHDRVNYAVTNSRLAVNKKKKEIILKLKIDVRFVPVIEYFEVFIDRMSYCRKASNYLRYKFRLEINNFELL
ncbi:MAG: phosphohydrolase [Parcubacteria group bacterium CG23_combo_of_CG06-09_8_20_14_all_35_9]|nr:MAG: phosphohydrolase [Parcubacteria group bacterium CG23_combo_of_CG06-09_8_20_14_all_35_9]